MVCADGSGRNALPGKRDIVFLAVLAAGLAGLHHAIVDLRLFQADGQTTLEWQRKLYLQILSQSATDTEGQSLAPHVFRPLPYGFTRAIEYVTGDLDFAMGVYRWYFTFWLLWAIFRFVALFHDRVSCWIAVGFTAGLYPFSIAYYLGQLTDPLSHFLFVLALIFVVNDRWLPLAAALALGVAAKETAVIIVPAYFLCYYRQGRPCWAKTSLLCVACVGAFLTTRLPLGWKPGLERLNGTEALMITTNLGIGEGHYAPAAPLCMNYLHPILFVGVFVPGILGRWRELDFKLRVLVVVLTPLLLASSLCFSWLYESRNYVPLLPVLLAAALPCRKRPSQATMKTNETIHEAPKEIVFPQ